MRAEISEKWTRVVTVTMPLEDARNLHDKVREGLRNPFADSPAHSQNKAVLERFSKAMIEAGVH